MKWVVTVARWFGARLWLRLAVWVGGIVLASLATFVLARSIHARGLPDLEPWHNDAPPGEFKAADLEDDFGLDEYLALEDRLFSGLDAYMVPPEDASRYIRYTRYIAGGPGDPVTFPDNWNRTTQFEPEGEPRGGALLLHGLTDSPYSLRAVGEILREHGFYVLAIRLPGHGTVPAALRKVRWEDWEAVARLGARHVAERVGDQRPLYVCGYSTGGALALKLAMEAIVIGGMRVPDRLYLFSPSIGVSAFAKLALVDQSLSFIPFFEKSAWLSVNPEYDPFKYNSFPVRAGFEVWQLTRSNAEAWQRLVERGGVEHFPPVITFHSAVDATVSNAAVRGLYDVLPANASELIVFDINHQLGIGPFLRRDPRVLTTLLERGDPLAYDVTVITNTRAGARDVVARRRSAGTGPTVVDTPLAAHWPTYAFSLSHVAIPFGAEDPLYGDGRGALPGDRLVLGAVIARGERGILSVSADEFMRMRYNPFFDYVRGRLEETLGASPSPAAPPKRYACARSSGPIVIDGGMDESAWLAAPWTDEFIDIEGDRRPRPRFRTRARMLWDDEHLYVGAELEEPHVWGTLRVHDEVVYHDNDFEIFVDPDGDTDHYYEVEVNALGTIFDLYLDRPYNKGGNADHDWHWTGMVHAVQVDGTLNDPSDIDRGWSVEFALPWSALGVEAGQPLPPRPGDVWRINFSRVQWRHEIDGARYEKAPETREDNWVWSPQGTINMHVPERWGYLEFGGLK
jgi:alpha-beta hydrolase superfamily lysophospholipase